jgi:hypothetical protein
LEVGFWIHARCSATFCSSDAILASSSPAFLDPALASPLLNGGGYMVLAKLLAKLRSQRTAERQAAPRFLVQIAGRDLGDDAAAWEAWVRGL